MENSATVNTAMESFKASQKKEILSWADVHFHAMLELFHARASGEKDRYEKAVAGLEILMAGFFDEDYLADMKLLEKRCDKMMQQLPHQQVFNLKTDEKASILSRLVYRCNQGRTRQKESVENSLIIKEIAKNIANGIGQNVVITGPLGSGKSESAIKIAQEVGKLTGHNWSVDDIVFTPLDFVKRYNNKDLTPKGSDIIFDEIGITHNARTNQSKANIEFNKIFQVLRHRELLCIFTLPDLSIIDITARKLMHWWFKTDYIDKKKGLCFMTPQVVEVVQRTGEILYPFPVFNGNQMSEFRVTQINDETRTAYKKLASKYKDDVGLDVEKQLSLLTTDKVDLRFEKYKQMRREGKKPTETAKALEIHSSTAHKFREQYDKLIYLEEQEEKRRARHKKQEEEQ